MSSRSVFQPSNIHQQHGNPNSDTSRMQHEPTTSPRRTTSKPLNFQKAMNDFGTMFPEIDRDVIETVLRANNGVVQSTIDQLLEIQTAAVVEQATNPNNSTNNTRTTNRNGNTSNSGRRPVLPSYEASLSRENEPPPAYSDIWEEVDSPAPDPRFEPPPPPSPQQHPSYNATQSRNLPSPEPPPRPPSTKKPNQNEPGQLSKKFSRNDIWGAPLLGRLPDDFLRLDITSNTTTSVNTTTVTAQNTTPNRQGGETGGIRHSGKFSSDDYMTDDDLERFLEDEKLAMFIQNEEFLRELRRNREFVTSLEEDHRQAMEASGTPVATPPSHGGARPRTTQVQEDAQFRQKLRHMGKSSRKKFRNMAKRFSRNKSGSKSSLSQSIQNSESTFNLLGDEENENEKTNDLHQISEEEGDYNLDQEEAHTTNLAEEMEKWNDQALQRPRPRPTKKGGRKLPQAPSYTQGRDEPIVFYSEDNEFAFKQE